MTTQTERFPFRTFSSLDPSYVDMARDNALDTAAVWTLHLDTASPKIEDVEALAATMLAAGALDACGGDDFAAWAEPFTGDDDSEDGRALHVYFRAESLTAALATATALCVSANDPLYTNAHFVTLSTAGDWAEQTEVFA